MLKRKDPRCLCMVSSGSKLLLALVLAASSAAAAYKGIGGAEVIGVALWTARDLVVAAGHTLESCDSRHRK